MTNRKITWREDTGPYAGVPFSNKEVVEDAASSRDEERNISQRASHIEFSHQLPNNVAPDPVCNDNHNIHRDYHNVEDMVYDFHKVFKHPVGDVPTVEDRKLIQSRVNLISEEFLEFMEATYGESEIAPMKQAVESVAMFEETEPDIVEMADALADMVYVIVGTAVALGIPFMTIFNEVHSSNMSKLFPDGTAHYRESDNKVIKGPNTFKPRILDILNQYGYDEDIS